MSEERFSDALPVGMVVQWFPRADVKAKPDFSGGPVPAIVVRSSDGICDLHVFHMSGQVKYHKAVYHASHPDLKDTWGRVTEMGARDGCWDFTAISKQQWEDQFAAQVAAEKAKRQAEDEARRTSEAEAEAKAKADLKAKREAEKAAAQK